MHAHRQAAVAALGGADQLQAEAELARVLEVVAVQVLDALVAHVVEMHRRAEREAREDRHLRGRVAAADVVAGVGLGVADALRLGERLRVARAAGHLGEDEVGGAVDDPVDALDRRRRERLLEHAHDRHHARDGRLEAQPHTVLRARSRTAPRRAGRAAACWRVTTSLPARIAASRYSRAGSIPPISSTIRSRLCEDLLEVAARAREHAADQRARGR